MHVDEGSRVLVPASPEYAILDKSLYPFLCSPSAELGEPETVKILCMCMVYSLPARPYIVLYSYSILLNLYRVNAVSYRCSLFEMMNLGSRKIRNLSEVPRVAK